MAPVPTDATRGQGGSRGLKITLAVAAGVIALLAAGPVALIWALGDADPRPPAIAAPGAPAGLDADASVTASAPPRASPVRPVTATSAEPALAPPAPEDVDPAWRDAPVVFRNRDVFGPVGLYVFAGLRDAEDAMKPCYAAGSRGAGEGAGAATDVPAVLMLYLQARSGAIDVVDARVDEPGTASPDVVECCRAILRGYEFKTPNAQAGRRYRLKYALR